MAYRFSTPSRYRYQTGDIFLGLDGAGNEIGVAIERHVVTVGGSRSGKGAALLVQNARRWPHNLLMIDPKGENAALTWKEREALGQQVAIIDPFGACDWGAGAVPDRLRATFNPLAEIDVNADSARAEIMAIANGLVVIHNKEHTEWIEGGRKLLAGFIAFVLASAPPEHRTFQSVRSLLLMPEGELEKIADDMAEDGRAGGLMTAAAATIRAALSSSKGKAKDVLGIAKDSTDWLDDRPIARALGSSSFRLSDLKTGKLSLYLVLPAGGDHMTTYAGFLRLFVKTALHAMDKGQKGSRCLFMLDEFFSLGKLEELAEAAGRMPSYGVHLWPFLQDLGQLHELYGPKVAETFFANADADIFLGNKDPFTLEYISKRLGVMQVDDIGVLPPTKGSFQPSAFSASAATDWNGNPLTGRDLEEHRTAQQNAAAAHDAEQKRRLTVTDSDYTNAVGEYNHQMQERGARRLSPDEIAQLIGKRTNTEVARSMIVFLSGGDILNLSLSPYFKPEGIAPVEPLPRRIRHHETERPSATPRSAPAQKRKQGSSLWIRVPVNLAIEAYQQAEPASAALLVAALLLGFSPLNPLVWAVIIAPTVFYHIRAAITYRAPELSEQKGDWLYPPRSYDAWFRTIDYAVKNKKRIGAHDSTTHKPYAHIYEVTEVIAFSIVAIAASNFFPFLKNYGAFSVVGIYILLRFFVEVPFATTLLKKSALYPTWTDRDNDNIHALFVARTHQERCLEKNDPDICPELWNGSDWDIGIGYTNRDGKTIFIDLDEPKESSFLEAMLMADWTICEDMKLCSRKEWEADRAPYLALVKDRPRLINQKAIDTLRDAQERCLKFNRTNIKLDSVTYCDPETGQNWVYEFTKTRANNRLKEYLAVDYEICQTLGLCSREEWKADRAPYIALAAAPPAPRAQNTLH